MIHRPAIPPPLPRQDYRQHESAGEDLKADPIEQFAAWFDEACKCRSSSPMR